MISSCGIAVGFVTLRIVQSIVPVKTNEDIEKSLKWILLLSTILQTPVLLGLAYFALPPVFPLSKTFPAVKWWHGVIPVLGGLWAGLAIGIATEYYTSHSYSP